MDTGKYIKMGLGVVVSFAFIWLITRNTDGAAFVQAIGAADQGWIALGVALFCAGYVCRIQRWRVMLNADAAHDITLKQAAVPFLISIAANNVLPFRAGDVMRALAFSGWLGIGNLYVLATMVVERLLDLLCLLIVFGLALFLLDSGIGASAGSLVGLGAGSILAMAAVVALVLLFPLAIKCVALGVLDKLTSHGSSITAKTAQFFDTLGRQAHGARMPVLVGWSVLAWCFEGSVFYAAARAIPSLHEPLAGLLAFPIATLATLLPSTPGYAGTFHYFAIQAAELMGNPVAAATAFAVLVHLILWLTATLAGGICAMIWVLSGKRVPRVQNTPQLDETGS
jgi:uncharacterized protein (TIRG00374 family)